MAKQYQLTTEQQDILAISSVLENAPYLLCEGEKIAYVGAGKCKSGGPCKSASSNSSGGTCRALSLENSVSE